jgi:uncharacterized protein (TIGR02302 family)
MTRLSQWIKFPAGSDRLERFILAARGVVAFERLWPRLWPASGIVGLFVALAFSGLLPLLPWPVHALILAVFVTVVGLSLSFTLTDFRWPKRRDGARRLECDNGLANRPISEAGDVLAAGAGDKVAEELWALHCEDRLRPFKPLRLSSPHSKLAERDPKSLRFAVLLLILGALIVSTGHWGERFFSAFGPAASEIPGLDAWIDPPVYTGEAPVYLSGGSQSVRIPAGSVLNVRVHGPDHAPFLSLQSAHFPWLPIGSFRIEGASGEYALRTVLQRDAVVRVRAVGRTIGKWRIVATPDEKPTIAFAEKPGYSGRAALKLAYAAHDDYGVVAVRALIRPAGGQGEMLVVDLKPPPGKDVRETVYRDLTAHPYAGTDVDIVLEATDAAGQTTTTAPVRIRMPELIFTDPLARALIELRQYLARQGFNARDRAALTLDALTVAPEVFYDGQAGTYLALRDAYWSLKSATSPADLVRIENLLWQMAAGLEQGGALSLAENLRRTQETLTQLMASGAPQGEIDALLERYTRLMKLYLQALGANAPPGAEVAGDKAMETGDIADLLAAIQTLSQSGDREKAAQLLAFLQNLIENMKVASGQGGTAENKSFQDLGDLIGKQRDLMDKTYRESQHAGDPKDGGGKGLARQQGALKDQLSNMLGNQKRGPEDLKRAGKLMGDAEGALANGDIDRAGALQKYVLDALRKGAGALAGPGGKKDGNQANEDPFGRQAGGRGGDPGREVPIPDAEVLRRARDILMELRRKAGEMNRPKEERDYIDRLLKQF